ncbi:hypothetical protein F5Y15DRAFT_366419 [Xylariaceae sp. FL0016]|nr:hypothetical protein F5Y15DRAFT_366419 [Xylariaceae sp. FL0016]
MISGTMTVVSMYTIQPQIAPETGTRNAPLSTSDIGGIVGGVVGFLLVLGVAAWFLYRHLSHVLRVVKETAEHSIGRKHGPNETISGEAPTTEVIHGNIDSPAEVWDPHSEGRHGRRTGELAGSYDAHGVSEVEA